MAEPIQADDPAYRSDALAAALEAQDTAAVAFALRNDRVIVPLLPVEGPPQVRVFRRGDADQYMLLLFSSAETYVRMIPQETDHRVLAYHNTSLTLRDDHNLKVDVSCSIEPLLNAPAPCGEDEAHYCINL